MTVVPTAVQITAPPMNVTMGVVSAPCTSDGVVRDAVPVATSVFIKRYKPLSAQLSSIRKRRLMMMAIKNAVAAVNKANPAMRKNGYQPIGERAVLNPKSSLTVAREAQIAKTEPTKIRSLP